MNRAFYVKCRYCGDLIMLIPNKNNKYFPIEGNSYNGEELFDPKKHIIHYLRCWGLKKKDEIKAMEEGY